MTNNDIYFCNQIKIGRPTYTLITSLVPVGLLTRPIFAKYSEFTIIVGYKECHDYTSPN